MKVEMLRKSSRRSIQEYKDFAKRNGILNVMYIEDEENVTSIDLENNTEEVIKMQTILSN